ncbi:MAG: CoA pyrophosphatase [Candidatus Marinimicrobia bacterium]|nr:CoA pyrophosphatase [Candidatus Neomarinimicrobiota bacterium]
MKLEKYIKLLTTITESDLPGNNAQQQMLARPRKPINFPNSPETAIPAAVLILLHKTTADVEFYLTERTDSVEHHKGQISLPGGVQEKNESLPDTARRETWEEIGINVEKIRIITALTSLYVPITGFKIHPFVGWINSGHTINTEPREVKKLYSIRIQNLLDNNSLANETRIIRGYEVMVPYFRFDECEVWGATAMILAEFRQLLLNLEFESA